MAKQDRITISTLTNAFEKLAYNQGLDASRVFDDMMQYIIYGFATDHPKLTHWSYTKDQTKQIHELMAMWFQVMSVETIQKGWFDVLGVLYENTIAGQSRRSNAGQFFTPMHICDLMAQINYPRKPQIVNKRISDPTSGSGRTLLAFNAIHPGNYLAAEDIDRTCAMMTVCNFLIHGCVGEVIWHDSLDPDSFYCGWKINEGLNNPFSNYFGIPHCRVIEQSESLVWQTWNNIKISNNEAKILKAENEVKQVVAEVVKIEQKQGQLTLF